MTTKYRLTSIPLIALAILLSFPTVALAADDCHGLGCLFSWNFGFTERASIHESGETERAQIAADQAIDEKRLENDRAAEETRLANEQAARLEEINRQADTAIAQAQSNATIATAEKEKYIAFVENWRQSQVELARFETDKALKALQGQTDLGLKSIVEAGETKRWALTTDLIWSVILIVGLVFLGWYFLKKQGQPQVIQVLSAPPNYPMLPNGNRAQLPGYRAQLPGRTQNVEQEITYYHDQ